MRRSPSILTISFLCIAGLAVRVVGEEYTENFTSTEFRDSLNTTAWWDTAAAELKLHAFEVSLVGTCDTPGSAGGVFIAGDFAYVADLLPGLQVIDISDPTNPTLAGGQNTPGDAKDVFVWGDHAYVADAASGLEVLDISDPTNPSLVGNYNTPGSARAVFVVGDQAYVADTASGLQVIDVSDPTNPTYLGSYDTPGSASGVFVWGHYAYVSDEGAGLQVIDISDPSAPTLAGSYNTPNIAWGVAVSGNYAYVADGSSGLQVIDISDPTTPTLAGSYDTPSSARDVCIAGDRAYLADWGSGLQVIDITDPTNPSFVMSYDTPGYSVSVLAWGEHAYVGDGGPGLLVIEVSDVTSPEIVGGAGGGGRALDVAGDCAYIGSGTEFGVIDVSDPTNPMEIGSVAVTDLVLGLSVTADHAYLAVRYSGLVVVDISDPTNPNQVADLPLPGPATDVEVSGDLAFVTIGNGGLRVIDITDPLSPTDIGSLNTTGYASGVGVSGDMAFVADGLSGLLVVDVGDPTNPVAVGIVDTPGSAQDLFIAGDHVYLADGEYSLLVIDIHDPANPVIEGSCAVFGSARMVEVSGDRAYVAAGVGGFRVIDVTNPSNPIPVDDHEMHNAQDVVIAGSHAYLMDDSWGLVSIIIRQDVFNTSQNRGQSRPVNVLAENIVRARLNATQQGFVDWDIAVGDGWQPFPYFDDWNVITHPGSELRWRSTHRWSGGEINPTVSQLQIEWLYEPATIDFIADVPEDQGGWLRLHFPRSGYDFAEETTHPVTGYGIHRRVDDPLLKTRVVGDPAGSSDGRADRSLAGLWHFPGLRMLDGRLYVEAGEGRSEEFPPGIWELVSWVPAMQQDVYIALVPTVGDSTGDGIPWSTYVITTHTTIPSVWYVSPPDSSYSIDNIAPSTPSGLTYAEGNLTWDLCPDEDFHYFTVYGGDGPEFDQAEVIGHTIDINYDVSGAPFSWYFVTASDRAGNESDPAHVEGPTTGLDGNTVELPTGYILGEVTPNPFTDRVTVTLDVPVPTPARLEVYDVSGRLVKTLMTGTLPAGKHQVSWAGTDSEGFTITPGLYFVRLESDRFTAAKKVVHIR